MLTDKSQNSSFILGIMGNISTQKVKNNECTAVIQKKKQTIVKVIQHQKLFFFFFYSGNKHISNQVFSLLKKKK